MIKMKKQITIITGILLVLTLFSVVSAFDYNEDDEGNPFLESEFNIKVPQISIRDLFILQPSSEPLSPELGMIYFDVDSKRLKLYDGTGWYTIALEKVSTVSKQQVKEKIEKKGEVQTCSESTECGDWGDCINIYQSITCISIDSSCNKYEDVETRDCISEFELESAAKDSLDVVASDSDSSEETETTETTEETSEEVEQTEEVEEETTEEIEPESEVENEPAEEVEPEEPEEVEEEEEAPAEESIPEELFDITFDLEENMLSSSDKLVVWITLQNFGKRYVPARLIYTVTDEQGEEVYKKFEEVRVYSDESLIKTFSDLTLDEGEYNLMLEVEYAGIVEDFELGFVVETGVWAGIKRFFGGLF